MLMTPAVTARRRAGDGRRGAPAIASNADMVPCVARRVMSRERTRSMALTAWIGSPARTAQRQSSLYPSAGCLRELAPLIDRVGTRRQDAGVRRHALDQVAGHVLAEIVRNLHFEADVRGARSEEAAEERADGIDERGVRCAQPRRAAADVLEIADGTHARTIIFDFRVTSLRPRNSMSIRCRCSWSDSPSGSTRGPGPSASHRDP